jgi:hypothetical protein
LQRYRKKGVIVEADVLQDGADVGNGIMAAIPGYSAEDSLHRISYHPVRHLAGATLTEDASINSKLTAKLSQIGIFQHLANIVPLAFGEGSTCLQSVLCQCVKLKKGTITLSVTSFIPHQGKNRREDMIADDGQVTIFYDRTDVTLDPNEEVRGNHIQ